jgi:hypothetical protein
MHQRKQLFGGMDGWADESNGEFGGSFSFFCSAQCVQCKEGIGGGEGREDIYNVVSVRGAGWQAGRQIGTAQCYDYYY